MVSFDYDEDRIYNVLVRPRNTTQIKLMPDERVTYVSAGDASSFVITVPTSKAFVEVKPKWDHVATNLLIVTTRRSYHIELQSTAEHRKWYTRVAWNPPSPSVVDHTRPSSGDATPDPASDGESPAPDAPRSPGDVALNRLSFGYTLEGEAAFRPVQVFDDGTHTYIRMPDALQELPALFAVTPDRAGDATLVNYSVSGAYLVVPRTLDQFVLKLGKAQVRGQRKQPDPGFLARMGFGRKGGS